MAKSATARAPRASRKTAAADAALTAAQAWRLELATALDVADKHKAAAEAAEQAAARSAVAVAISAADVFADVEALKEAVKAVYMARGAKPLTASARASDFAAVYNAAKAGKLPAEIGGFHELTKQCRAALRPEGAPEEKRGRAPRTPTAPVPAEGAGKPNPDAAPTPARPASPIALIEQGVNELKRDCKSRAALAILAELADMVADLAELLGTGA